MRSIFVGTSNKLTQLPECQVGRLQTQHNVDQDALQAFGTEQNDGKTSSVTQEGKKAECLSSLRAEHEIVG